jgi:hypothetical protein
MARSATRRAFIYISLALSPGRLAGTSWRGGIHSAADIAYDTLGRFADRPIHLFISAGGEAMAGCA